MIDITKKKRFMRERKKISNENERERAKKK